MFIELADKFSFLAQKFVFQLPMRSVLLVNNIECEKREYIYFPPEPGSDSNKAAR